MENPKYTVVECPTCQGTGVITLAKPFANVGTCACPRCCTYLNSEPPGRIRLRVWK